MIQFCVVGSPSVIMHFNAYAFTLILLYIVFLLITYRFNCFIIHNQEPEQLCREFQDALILLSLRLKTGF